MLKNIFLFMWLEKMLAALIKTGLRPTTVISPCGNIHKDLKRCVSWVPAWRPFFCYLRLIPDAALLLFVTSGQYEDRFALHQDQGPRIHAAVLCGMEQMFAYRSLRILALCRSALCQKRTLPALGCAKKSVAIIRTVTKLGWQGCLVRQRSRPHSYND